MDVYIDKKEKVWVVNVEAYDDAMNTGLFSKEELDAIMDKEELVYRVVEEEGSTLPSEQLFYQLPLDMQKLSSDKEVAEFISNLKQCCVCSTLPTSSSIVFVQHFQPQAVACLFNTSNLKQYHACSTKPSPGLTALNRRCVHHLHVLHEGVRQRAQVRHQREVLQLLVEHRHEFLLRHHRHGGDRVEHLARLLCVRRRRHLHLGRGGNLLVHHLLDVLLRLFQRVHQRLHLRLQTLQVVVRLCIAVGNLGLLLNRLNSTHVLDGSQARDDLVLHGGRGGAQRQLGELDGEDLRVQHDGCDGICIDVNALALETHVHSEEDLPSTPIPTPTGLNTWHKDL